VDDEVGLRLLFEQVNEHLRSTDSKSVDLTVAYFAVVTVAISIITAVSHKASITQASTGRLVVAWALVFIGCLVYWVQSAYRGWKLHYLDVLGGLAWAARLERDLLPDFLRNGDEPRRHNRHSADNPLIFFTAFVTLCALSLADYEVVRLTNSRCLYLVVVIATGAAFFAVILSGWHRGFAAEESSITVAARKRASSSS
jgi:hypothetical protein